jgi:5-hydroxyisourate hydrolase-like protein (transthyretin family)
MSLRSSGVLLAAGLLLACVPPPRRPPRDEPPPKKPPLPAPLEARPLPPAGAPAPGSLEVTVRRGERPVAGVALLLRRSQEERLVAAGATGADGRCTFAAVPAGLWHVEVVGEPVGLDVLLASGEVPARAAIDLDAKAPAGSLVRGRVVDAQGHPRAGVRVTGSAHSFETPAFTSPLWVHTDLRGEFQIRLLGFGIGKLDAFDPGSGEAATGEIGDRELEKIVVFGLAPDQRPACRGRVVDPAGAPAEGVTVELVTSQESPRGQRVALTGPDGRFSLPCHLQATSQLTARDGWRVVRAVPQPGGESELRLQEGARLRVRLETAHPVKSARVRWIPEPDVGFDAYIGAEPLLRAEEVVLSGQAFTLGPLPVGEPVALYVATDDLRVAEGTVTLGAPGDWEAVLDLDRYAALRLRPVDSSRQEAMGLACLDTPSSSRDCLAFAGRHEVAWTRLPPGEHVLRLYDVHALPWRGEEKSLDRPIKLVGGETLDLGEQTVPAK